MATTTERTHNLVVRVAADELALMRRLAEIAREPAATLVRRWIRQHAEALGISLNAETVTPKTNRRRTR